MAGKFLQFGEEGNVTLCPDVYESHTDAARLIPNRIRQERRSVAVWQFKNGSLAPIYSWSDVPNDVFMAWDRGLGCDVVYAR